MAEENRKRMRLISEKPVITETLESWKPILPRPYREERLETWKKAEEYMRSEDFRVSLIVNGIIYGTIGALQAGLGGMAPILTESVEKRLKR